MESVDYSASSSQTPEQSTASESTQDWSQQGSTSDSTHDWGQQNGVHLSDSGLPSMAYDMPAVSAHEEASQPVASTETPSKQNWTPASATPTGPTARAREYAQQLATALSELGRSLDDDEAEHAQWDEERHTLEERIRELQQYQITKDRFVDVLQRGSAGSVTNEDLQTIRGMMDALSQDPDRLTVLFTVVQQASKLAAVVNDYVSLRHLAEGA